MVSHDELEIGDIAELLTHGGRPDDVAHHDHSPLRPHDGLDARGGEFVDGEDPRVEPDSVSERARLPSERSRPLDAPAAWPSRGPCPASEGTGDLDLRVRL